MKRVIWMAPVVALSAAATVWAQNVGKPTPIPAATSSRPHASYVEHLTATQPGERVIKFLNADVGHPVKKVTQDGVTFELWTGLRQSQAEPRVMFFPHIMTERDGILNAMANEQAIPVKVTFPEPASRVTLVMWASTDSAAKVQALGADDQVLDSAMLEKAPSRLDPGDPVPSFELTVKGGKIAYVLFGGARNGEYLAAEEIRWLPAGGGAGTATQK